MAFVNPFQKKSWKDRIVEFAGRRKLTRISGDPNGVMIADVERAEGETSQDGDAFSKSNMDDLESRIENAFDKHPEWVYDESGKITGYKTKAGADTEFPFSGGNFTAQIVAVSQASSTQGWWSGAITTTITLKYKDGKLTVSSSYANGGYTLNTAHSNTVSGTYDYGANISVNAPRLTSFTKQ